MLVHAIAAALSLASPAASAAGPVTTVRTERFTPEDQRDRRYAYVPFEVPPGTARVGFSYAYDRANGQNVVDLGVFEPGPLDLGTRAFRGWSGGERQSVTIGPADATPGYWPGPIPAGTWHVMLGLYKVAPAGVDVEVTFTTEAAAPGRAPAPAATALPRRPPPRGRGRAWYSGALHTHTVHSDGALTAVELTRRSREAGHDFVAITDHNNTAHQVEAMPDDGMLRIVGEEVTTPGGHASVWGLGGARDDVDFRVRPGDPRIADLVKAVVSRGALFSINHPRSTCLACDWTHPVPEGVAGIEITNGRHQEQEAAVAFWDALLAQGRRITAVGSSDWHRPPAPIEAASVRVWAEDLTEKAVLDGIRSGRVVVMADARTPPPEMTVRSRGRRARPGDTLVVGARDPVAVEVALPAALRGGRVDLVWDGAVVDSRRDAPARVVFRRAGPGRYVRVHVFGADGLPRAVVNPVYLQGPPRSGPAVFERLAAGGRWRGGGGEPPRRKAPDGR